MSGDAELQTRFAAYLRRTQDLGKDEEARRFADEHIRESPRLSPVEQLEIYREQFWLRHTASLVEDFPGVGGLLGQERWDRLIWAYLASDARYSFTLQDLGERLPDFVARQDHLEQRELVEDMARYEWARLQVFDAVDVPRLDPTKLASVPEDAWERARLVTDPALRLVATRFPVAPLRHRLLHAQNDPDASAPERPAPSATFLAVHRRERDIRVDALEPSAFRLLEALAADEPLGKACETAAAATNLGLEALSRHLERWFGAWATLGYVVDVVVDDTR